MDSMTTTLLSHPFQVLTAAVALLEVGRVLLAALGAERREQPIESPQRQAA